MDNPVLGPDEIQGAALASLPPECIAGLEIVARLQYEGLGMADPSAISVEPGLRMRSVQIDLSKGVPKTLAKAILRTKHPDAVPPGRELVKCEDCDALMYASDKPWERLATAGLVETRKGVGCWTLDERHTYKFDNLLVKLFPATKYRNDWHGPYVMMWPEEERDFPAKVKRWATDPEYQDPACRGTVYGHQDCDFWDKDFGDGHVCTGEYVLTLTAPGWAAYWRLHETRTNPVAALSRDKVSLPHKDGPEPPTAFWFGNKHVDLAPIPWKLLKHVWAANEQCCKVEVAVQAVWGADASTNALDAAKRKANKALQEVGCAKFLQIKNGFILLS